MKNLTRLVIAVVLCGVSYGQAAQSKASPVPTQASWGQFYWNIGPLPADGQTYQDSRGTFTAYRYDGGNAAAWTLTNPLVQVDPTVYVIPSLPPAPVVKVAAQIGFKVFGKSGRELKSGEIVVLEEVHDGKTVITCTPGYLIGFKQWIDGRQYIPNEAVTIFGGVRCDPTGTIVLGSFGLTGPAPAQRQLTERIQWYEFPYGTADYRLLGDFTLTTKHSEDLVWERKNSTLSYNPFIYPYLVDVYTAEQLGIDRSLYNAIRDQLHQ